MSGLNTEVSWVMAASSSLTNSAWYASGNSATCVVIKMHVCLFVWIHTLGMLINQAYFNFIQDFAKKSLTQETFTVYEQCCIAYCPCIEWKNSELCNRAWIRLIPLASRGPQRQSLKPGCFWVGTCNSVPAGLINSVMQQAVHWQHLWRQNFRITQGTWFRLTASGIQRLLLLGWVAQHSLGRGTAA